MRHPISLASALPLSLLVGCLTSQAEYQGLLAWATDADEDGYAPRDGDCDDDDPDVYPGAVDIWYDGIDSDCDGWHDSDADHDGIPIGEDCDDEDPLVAPGLDEECDGVDEDCDGEIDEGMGATWYADEDGDGYGDPEASAVSCLAPSSFVAVDGDCDDDNDAVYPGAAEVCGDGVVNDCEGYGGECRLSGVLSLEDTADLVLLGEGESDLTGDAVAVGDFTGDGAPDFAISAPENHGNGTNAGVVYLLPSPQPLDVLEAPDDVPIAYFGYDQGFRLGRSLGFAGDLNGDGRDELLISSREHPTGSFGAAYLVVPSASGDRVIDSTTPALLMNSYFNEGAFLAVGDVDSDGQAEVAIAHSSEDGGRGAIYIWEAFDGAQDISDGDARLQGEARGDMAGDAIARSDLNGDGIPDLLIAAPLRSSERGTVYLLLGPISSSVSLTDADATLDGELAGDKAGDALDAGGDVDGDGLADFVIGASSAWADGDAVGRAYVFTAMPAGRGVVDEAATSLTGSTKSSLFGQSVGVRSDMDNDGTSDVIVGAEMDGVVYEGSGAVYVWYEPRDSDLASDEDLVLHGGEERAGAGRSVVTGFDADRDSVDDLLIGSTQFRSPDGLPVGAVHLVLGVGP